MAPRLHTPLESDTCDFVVIAKLGDEVRVVDAFARAVDAEHLAACIVAHDYAPQAFIAHIHDAVDRLHPAVRRRFPSLARAH